jgi:hypothetical protein
VVVVAAVAVAVETRTFIDHRSINKRNSHHMSSTHVLRHNLLGGLLSLTVMADIRVPVSVSTTSIRVSIIGSLC